MRKHLLALATILALSPSLLAQKIGVINSMSGPEAPIGENITNGIKLAEEDLKKKGFMLQLVWEDDTGKPQISMSAMEKLATRDNVVGVVGPYTSACSNAVARLAERYKVPLLIPAAAKEEITRQGFKIRVPDECPGRQVRLQPHRCGDLPGEAQNHRLHLREHRFRHVHVQDREGLCRQEGHPGRGGCGLIPKGSADYRSTLAQIKSRNPDLVFMVSYVADAILLMRQSREVGLQPQAFLGAGAGFTTAEFANERAVSENVISCTQWTEDVNWPGAKEFGKRYKARFGKEPSYHAACAYASMVIMAETARGRRRGPRQDPGWIEGGQVEWRDGRGPVRRL